MRAARSSPRRPGRAEGAAGGRETSAFGAGPGPALVTEVTELGKPALLPPCPSRAELSLSISLAGVGGSQGRWGGSPRAFMGGTAPA